MNLPVNGGEALEKITTHKTINIQVLAHTLHAHTASQQDSTLLVCAYFIIHPLCCRFIRERHINHAQPNVIVGEEWEHVAQRPTSKQTHTLPIAKCAASRFYFLSFILMCCCPAAFTSRDHNSGTLAFEEVVAVHGRMSASAIKVPRVVKSSADFSEPTLATFLIIILYFY